jgi:hypothetical protein
VDLLVGLGPLENLLCRRAPLFPAVSARWDMSGLGHRHLLLPQKWIERDIPEQREHLYLFADLDGR